MENSLPELPGAVRRILTLQWESLCREHGFTGAHLAWPKTRRRKVYSAPPPPITPVGQGLGLPVEWRSPNFDPFEPAEHVGIRETANIAKLRFEQLTSRHFDHWRQNSPGDYTGFADRMKAITAQVIEEVSTLWAARPGWFAASCRKPVESELEGRRADWTAKARDVELARLEAFVGGVQTRNVSDLILNAAAIEESLAEAAAETVGVPHAGELATPVVLEASALEQAEAAPELRARVARVLRSTDPETKAERIEVLSVWKELMKHAGKNDKFISIYRRGLQANQDARSAAKGDWERWRSGKQKTGSEKSKRFMAEIRRDLERYQ